MYWLMANALFATKKWGTGCVQQSKGMGGGGVSIAMPVSSAWCKLHLVKTPPSEALPLQPTLTYMDLYSASTTASNKMLNVPLYLQQ
jgi:hypothetical protein